MKHRIAFINLSVLAVFLVLAPIALASNTWYVNGVNGSDSNDCKSPQTACKTIGRAISLAHSGDSIMVAPATYTENLTIGVSLKVIGAGASTTIIDGGLHGTVVTIPDMSAHVTLSKVTIQNGLGGAGGGINNSGTLTINSSTIRGNSASGDGGGIYTLSGKITINSSTIRGNSASADGGGIYSRFTGMTINSSTISGNSAFGHGAIFGGGGGGIFQITSAVRINSSTISGNFAQSNNAYGGGIYTLISKMMINSSTLSENEASTAGGGIAMRSGRSATLQNSIVANNHSNTGGNCAANLTSNGYNLSSDASCNFTNTGDLNNTDPKLGTLGNYGGPTQTIPLLSGSPAIDAGNPSGCTDGHGHLLKTDQRGKPRPDKEDTGGCDMGAYERQKD